MARGLRGSGGDRQRGGVRELVNTRSAAAMRGRRRRASTSLALDPPTGHWPSGSP